MNKLFEITTFYGMRMLFKVEREGSMIRVEQIWCDHPGPIWPAFKPYFLTGLSEYFSAPAPAGASVRRVMNEGTYYNHPALETIVPIFLDVDEEKILVNYDVKRYRLNKACSYSYVCPIWLLPYLKFDVGDGWEAEWKPFEEPKAPEGYDPSTTGSTLEIDEP